MASISERICCSNAVYFSFFIRSFSWNRSSCSSVGSSKKQIVCTLVFYVFFFFPFSNGNLCLGCGQFRQGGIKSSTQTSPLVIIEKVRMDVLLGMQALQPRHTPADNPTATFIQFTWKVICVQHNTAACLSTVLNENIPPFFDFKFPFRFRVFPGILYPVILSCAIISFV